MIICETFKPTEFLHKEAIGWFFRERYYCMGHDQELYTGTFVRHFSLYYDYKFTQSNKYLTKEYISEYLQDLQSE